jgi:hypothetical protein
VHAAQHCCGLDDGLEEARLATEENWRIDVDDGTVTRGSVEVGVDTESMLDERTYLVKDVAQPRRVVRFEIVSGLDDGE